jgi:SAM-dependent methyltransferase
MQANSVCRLCGHKAPQVRVDSGNDRDYYLCTNCKLISMDPRHFLSREKEVMRYLEHKNGPQYAGYTEFLNRAIEPALKYISIEMIGLDYGCGYSPTLSKMLIDKGYLCEDYDPLFVENPLNKKYDDIFSTEVFEHFFNPHEDIKKIYDLLRPGGYFTVMTVLWKDLEKFCSWYYIKDPAHTAFYHSETFEYICEAFGFAKIYDDGNRVLILRKLP